MNAPNREKSFTEQARVGDAALRQAGIFQADSAEELRIFSKFLAIFGAMKGKRVGIKSFPGGDVVRAIDAPAYIRDLSAEDRSKPVACYSYGQGVEGLARTIEGIGTGGCGESAADMDALVDAILKVSQIALAHLKNREIDRNPIFAGRGGAQLIAVRLILHQDVGP